jgi:hypothetical protein
MRVSFVRFVDEFCSACTPFLGGVAIFSHESEQEVDKIVGWFREVLEDFVWDCVWSGSFTGRRLVACGHIVIFG